MDFFYPRYYLKEEKEKHLLTKVAKVYLCRKNSSVSFTSLALVFLQGKTRAETPNLWGEEFKGLILPRMFQMSKQKTCLFNISIFSKPLQSADGIQKSKGRTGRGEGRERNISWK